MLKVPKPIIGKYGKYTKEAILSLGYGRSLKNAIKGINLSIRRLKVLQKYIKRGGLTASQFKWRLPTPLKVAKILSPTGRHIVWKPQYQSLPMKNPQAIALKLAFNQPGVC